MNKLLAYAQRQLQLDHAVDEGFLPPQHRAKLIICENPEQISNVIKNLNSPEHIRV